MQSSSYCCLWGYIIYGVTLEVPMTFDHLKSLLAIIFLFLEHKIFFSGSSGSPLFPQTSSCTCKIDMHLVFLVDLTCHFLLTVCTSVLEVPFRLSRLDSTATQVWQISTSSYVVALCIHFSCCFNSDLFFTTWMNLCCRLLSTSTSVMNLHLTLNCKVSSHWPVRSSPILLFNVLKW